jgi:putative addiction module component (TIGR02574 family)
MTERSLELLTQALSLTEKERAELAASLLSSLDEPPDPEAELLWQDEISKRVADLDSGRSRAIPWEEVQLKVSNLLQHGSKKA